LRKWFSGATVSAYAEMGVREWAAGRRRIVWGLIVTGRVNVYVVSCRNATLMVTLRRYLGDVSTR
jgi:hypothetical protein